MATKHEINKILIVLIILVILLVGIVYVRVKKSDELNAKKALQQKIIELGPSLNPTQTEEIGVMRLLPSRQNVRINEQFAVKVEVSTPGKKLDGADAYITFDPTSLEVVDVVEGAFFSTYPRKTVDNINGTVKVTGFNNAASKPLNNSIEFFTLQLVGKKTGSSQLQIGFTKGQTSQSNIVENQTSKNLLGKVENAVVIVGE